MSAVSPVLVWGKIIHKICPKHAPEAAIALPAQELVLSCHQAHGLVPVPLRCRDKVPRCSSKHFAAGEVD